MEAFCGRNITDLAVKGLKSKYKFAAKSILCVYFSFSSLENLARRQRQNFPYNSETFFKVFVHFGTNHFRCVPFGRLIVARTIFVIFGIFKFSKISI